jgi:hypothetical protein
MCFWAMAAQPALPPTAVLPKICPEKKFRSVFGHTPPSGGIFPLAIFGQ